MAEVLYVVPILPGQKERAASFGADLGHRQAAYEALNRRVGMRRHREWIQSLPNGMDVVIVMFDVDDPAGLARAFSDDDYDTWWRERVTSIHGFDPADAADFSPGQVAFDWTSEGAAPGP